MTLPQEPNGEAWTFRDYAPMVFRALRELYGVNHKYYMVRLASTLCVCVCLLSY